MIPEALLVGLNEISAVLLSILNYTLISQLLGLRTSTAWLQLLLFTAREREFVYEQPKYIKYILDSACY